ncbi:MAG: hypothetical protein IRZ16_19920 [Myxococcaceae bacterium]|nr:hypothetical protein [Myxococcaceae bacterium]
MIALAHAGPLAIAQNPFTVALSAAVIGALAALAGLLGGWLVRPERAPVPVPVRTHADRKR